MDNLCKPNFMFLGCTVFEKNAMRTCKNSKLQNCPIKQFEILQDRIAFFYDTVRPRNLKFFFVY